MHRGEQDEIGDDAAVQIHADEADDRVELFAGKIPLGEAVGKHGGDERLQHGDNDGSRKRDAEGAENIGILQNGTPALKGELLRQQCGKAIFGNGLCIVEGVDHAVPHRVNGDQHDDHHDDTENDVETLIFS